MGLEKRDIQIEKIDNEHLFLIKTQMEEKVTPDQLLNLIQSREENLKAITKDIQAIPEIIEARTKQLNEQLTYITQEIEVFSEVESHARLWKKEQELLNQRAGISSDEKEDAGQEK